MLWWGSCSILRSSPETSAFLIRWPLRGKYHVEDLVAELSLFSSDQVCTLVSDCRFSKLLSAVCERTRARQIFFSVGAQKSYRCYLALVFPQTPPHQCPAALVSTLWCDRCQKGSWLSSAQLEDWFVSPFFLPQDEGGIGQNDGQMANVIFSCYLLQLTQLWAGSHLADCLSKALGLGLNLLWLLSI